MFLWMDSVALVSLSASYILQHKTKQGPNPSWCVVVDVDFVIPKLIKTYPAATYCIVYNFNADSGGADCL